MMKSRNFKITYIGPLRWISGSDHFPHELEDPSSVPGIHSGKRESIHESCPLSYMMSVSRAHPDKHMHTHPHKII